jgi:predicted transcriptional regulator
MRKNAMKTTTIQLPQDTLKHLRQIAQKEGRSVASQVRIFLADSVTRINTEKQPEEFQPAAEQ